MQCHIYWHYFSKQTILLYLRLSYTFCVFKNNLILTEGLFFSLAYTNKYNKNIIVLRNLLCNKYTFRGKMFQRKPCFSIGWLLSKIRLPCPSKQNKTVMLTKIFCNNRNLVEKRALRRTFIFKAVCLYTYCNGLQLYININA